MKNFHEMRGNLKENTQMLYEARRNTIGGNLVMKLSKYIRVDEYEAEAFLLGGAPGSGEKAEENALKKGYNPDGGGYDKFWQKVYTPVEFAIAMSLAAGDFEIGYNTRLF